jgi:hypothetical protein
VRVAQRIAFFIPHGFQELVDPDRGIDSKALAVERWEGRRARGRPEDGPEACNSHLVGLKSLLVAGCEL